jgi:hypothetical protein
VWPRKTTVCRIFSWAAVVRERKGGWLFEIVWDDSSFAQLSAAGGHAE